MNGGITSYLFTNNGGGTFPLAQAELLIDALRYTNTAALPNKGNRNFTVNVRNTTFKSPDAIFTPNVTCVTISGNIWIDNNALVNNTVDSSSRIGQLAANGAYAVLVNPTTNAVIAVRGVSAGGAYNFGKQSRSTYNIIIRNSAPNVGDIITAPTYPSGTSGVYRSTGENLGLAAGNDLQVDGILKITIGSDNITNANFGIELAPVTANTTFNTIPNPGSYNNYTIPNGGFNATDEDGTVSSITITSFPAGANYLQIGSTIYTSTGSTCPPQSSCTAWPGTVTVPFSGGNPTQAISVDPLANATTAVTIPFTATDNGNVVSNASSVTVNFSAISTFAIGGNVWNDANGNGSLDGAETLTAIANGGQTLYAYLVQTSNTYSGANTIYASVAVSATTGYSFANVPAGNNYEVRIVSAATAPAEGTLASAVTPALATGYTTVSTTLAGVPTTGLNTNNPVITITNLTASQINDNFGIERRAVTSNFTAVKQLNQGVTTQVAVPVGAFSATDAEDAPAGYTGNLAGRTVTLNPATSGTVLYNGNPVTIATAFPGFDPTKVTVLPPSTGVATATFTFAVTDNAGLVSAPSTVNVPFDGTSVAISGIIWDDINGDAVRTPATEPLTGAGGALYALLADTLGNVIQTSLINNTTGAYSFDRGTGSQAYNVILSTTNVAIGSKVAASSLPGNWVSTGTNLNTTASTTNLTGIARITTPASGAVTAQNFGIEQRAVADAKAFTISGNAGAALTKVTVTSTAGAGTYNNRIAVSGTASSGNTPGVLTGTDADGNNGSSLAITEGSALKLSINPASYTALNGSGTPVANGIMLMYNGVQLQPGGCQGGDAGTICTYYNAVTGAWEIPNYNASLLTVLVKNGVKTQSFQYSFVDAANKQGATATYSITSTVPLPVDLISFTAKAQGKEVSLDWQVANEAKMAGYTIERSADAKSFTAINKVTARNAQTTDEYHVTDAAPLNGANYYRLKMEEKDGSYTYSSVQLVEMNNVAGDRINLYPNPVTSGTSFTVHTDVVPASGSVMVMDQAGKVLYSQLLDHSMDTRVSIGNLPAGIYIVAVIQDGRSQFTKLVVQ